MELSVMIYVGLLWNRQTNYFGSFRCFAVAVYHWCQSRVIQNIGVGGIQPMC